MKLASKNMAIVAAVMVLQSHLKDDLSSLDDSDCLLSINAANFIKCSEHPDREGAYLYFDLNRGVFVRSGKVVGRGFVVRDAEHEKEAKAVTASSFFYRMFPSVHSPRGSRKGKRGTFESLSQVIAAGFDPNHEVATYLDKDISEGGLMILSEAEKKYIKSSMNNLKCADITKFHHILAYQLELGYDLAISPDNNVSTSPGHESVLGVTSNDV